MDIVDFEDDEDLFSLMSATALVCFEQRNAVPAVRPGRFAHRSRLRSSLERAGA